LGRALLSSLAPWVGHFGGDIAAKAGDNARLRTVTLPLAVYFFQVVAQRFERGSRGKRSAAGESYAQPKSRPSGEIDIDLARLFRTQRSDHSLRLDNQERSKIGRPAIGETARLDD
jgi:hypothetical protein